MKKLIFSLFACSTLFLAGCFETTEEITLKEDGTGTFTTTNDLSAIIAVVKQMGGNEAKEIEDAKLDTTILLATQVDSIPSLSPEEKELMRNGSMHMDVDLNKDKLRITMKFPFTRTSDVPKFSKISAKLMGSALKDKLGKEDARAAKAPIPEASSFDEYFDFKYSKGLIVKELNKEKYANVETDPYLKGMKEAGSMGIPITVTQVINLPRPAKSVKGKNAQLSDDKMKVTVKADIDEFFDEPTNLEYKIEY